jgi:predicted RNA-binding protein with PUA-like domain
MLEKDIENLIATHPEEFLPYKNLKLVGQQVRLSTYFADIIFEDEYQTKIVIEVKRGILSREAVAQIMDYYGIIKIQEKTSDIKLIIVANVIPKERVIFLSEKLGIEFIEIPASKIINVAKEYSYSFLDETKPETKIQYKEQTQEIDKNISFGKSDIWIFQANPQRFDILNALADDEMKEDVWLVARYKDRIKKGDIGIVWMCGKDSGIYALAEIMNSPEFMEEPKISTKYWMSDDDKEQIRLRVKLKYTLKLLNNPILREELKSIPELKDMAIFRQPQGTNFPVTQDEWKVISDLIKERLNV